MIRVPARATAVFCLTAAAVEAQSPTFAFIPGSSVRLEQIIGDCDYQAQAPQIVKGLPGTLTVLFDCGFDDIEPLLSGGRARRRDRRLLERRLPECKNVRTQLALAPVAHSLELGVEPFDVR